MKLEKTARVLVKRHRGQFVSVVFLPYQSGYGRRPLRIQRRCVSPDAAAISGRAWAHIHGFQVTHVLYQHGLRGPSAVGEYVVEVQ